MTEVVDAGTVGLDTGLAVGRPRRDAAEPRLVDEELADRLLAQAAEQGVELLGEGGLLKQMTKAILERSLQVELTDHLGYEEGDPAGAGSGNSRNGTTPKRLATEAGHVDLDVPRDRQGTFEPQTVKKGQRRLDGVDKLVMGLYARGMTVRDIQTQLKETFDLDVSHDLISKITDGVLEEVAEWQHRPLDTVYPVIFLDALICKVRHEGHRPEQGRAPGGRGRRRRPQGGPGDLGRDRRGRLVLAARHERAQGPRRRGRPDRGLRRPHRPAGGRDGVLAPGGRADLHRPPRPGLAALGQLQGPQARRRRAPQDLRRPDRDRRPRRAGRLDRVATSARTTRRSSGSGKQPGSRSSRSSPSAPRSARSSTRRT